MIFAFAKCTAVLLANCDGDAVVRVVSSAIYSNLSGNFRQFVKEFFSLFMFFNYSHIKIIISMFFDKQLSRSLSFNFMHYV